MHPSRLRQSAGWGQPPAGWGQSLPGWAPLVDPGPLPLRAASSVTRWWWPTLAIGAFVAVVVQVLSHDDRAPGLSHRGLLTIASATAVVVLLTIHRRNGPRPLARAVAEYTMVALLAALLAVAGGGVDQPPADQAKPAKADHAKVQSDAKPNVEAAAGDDQPAVLQVGAKVVRAVTGAARALAGAVRWLIDLWRRADQQASKGEAMPAPPRSPIPSAPSIWRSPA
jgi:hypothetical protein